MSHSLLRKYCNSCRRKSGVISSSLFGEKSVCRDRRGYDAASGRCHRHGSDVLSTGECRCTRQHQTMLFSSSPGRCVHLSGYFTPLEQGACQPPVAVKYGLERREGPADDALAHLCRRRDVYWPADKDCPVAASSLTIQCLARLKPGRKFCREVSIARK